MKKLILVALLIYSCIYSIAYSEEARLLRFPDVNGDKVAFVYGDDIYLAPRTGGTAIRLTSHEGREWFPKFSPDGSRIAFTGQYDGDMAVYVMPVDGGEPQKLTFHPAIQRTSARFGPDNLVMGWHPDGQKVLYRSRKKTNDWWDGRVYFVNINGGMPEPLPMATAGFTSLSPNMDKVAYCPIYRDFRTWKRYKGGMAQDVWIFDLKTYESQRITNWEGTDKMPMWHDKYIYFNADRTGTLNLYKFDTENKTIKQVTEFTEYDVRWPSLGPDGIAFENGGYIYVLDLPSERIQKIDIELTTDRHTVRSGYVDVSDKIRDFDISPDAKRSVFSARGELFTVPAKEGNTRNLTRTSGANEREPAWSPDGRWIAYISDESGEEELYIVSHEGEEKIRLTTDGYCHRYRPFWSPDSKKLAFADKTGKLILLYIKSKELKLIDECKREGINYCSWSPDSRFITYSKQDDDRITCIFIYSLDDEEIHQVTPGYTHDFSPVFDPDGKYLYFLSQRNFNPILSEYEFEFVNQAITNLFMIPLSAHEKSPFAPESDEVVIGGEGEDDSDKKGNKADIKVEIDFDGMHEREIGIDIPSGRYRGLSAVSGAVFFSSQPMYGLRGRIGDDKTTLHKYVIADEKLHDYADGVSRWNISAAGGKMLLKKGDNFYIENTSADKAVLENPLDLSGMEMRLDRQKEFEQIFHEVWRMERDFFYDENLHGVDWEKTRDRYKVLLPHAATRHDLTYILGEMVGELCCSHTYIGGGDYPKIEDSGVGLLGVDFEIDEKHGRYRIVRILKGENWDESMRSPLRDPGLNVKEGEYLLAINGKELTTDINPYSLLTNCAGKIVTLKLSEKPGMKNAREIEIKPINSEESLRYYNWVEWRRHRVDSLSNGKIGYIHIPDMDSFGLYRFVKMYYHQFKKPGLIIDVRYNGGGFVSGLILERLRREVIAMGASRNFEEWRAPGGGIHAHMITLINEFSCSDGDYFPHFFREYELGPLVGKRTWGGIVGINGYRPLIDGGYYTVPQFTSYSLEGEWLIENVGVIPDIEVDNPPDRMARGYDDQLDWAINDILEKLKKDPKKLPERPGPPKER